MKNSKWSLHLITTVMIVSLSLNSNAFSEDFNSKGRNFTPQKISGSDYVWGVTELWTKVGASAYEAIKLYTSGLSSKPGGVLGYIADGITYAQLAVLLGSLTIQSIYDTKDDLYDYGIVFVAEEGYTIAEAVDSVILSCQLCQGSRSIQVNYSNFLSAFAKDGCNVAYQKEIGFFVDTTIKVDVYCSAGDCVRNASCSNGRCTTDDCKDSTDTGLPIELAAASVKRTGESGVQLRWQTASETLNKEWNILRHLAGSTKWEKVNGAMIPGAGTAPFGKTYEFTDASAASSGNYEYKLEWISENGDIQQSKEIPVNGSLGKFFTPAREDSPAHSARPSAALSDMASVDLKSQEQSAEYVIITLNEFVEAASSLADFRTKKGLKGMVAPVETIYDQFPGYTGENAILEFLRFAYNNWSAPRLRFVLLLGDAEMKPEGEQQDTAGLIPTFVRTMEGVGLIPTDYPYSLLGGNELAPDLSVGRLPARSLAEAEGMVNKIIKRESSPKASDILFTVGDYYSDLEKFAETSTEAIIKNYCDAVYSVSRLYTMPQEESLYPYKGTATDLEARLNQGVGWVEFRGHGSANSWAGLLEPSAASALHSSGDIPIINSVSCFTGSFADAQNQESIAEALLRNPSGGAVAYIGNSGHGMLYTGHDFSSSLWEQITHQDISIGEAVNTAKKEVLRNGGTVGLLFSINILGDPATYAGSFSIVAASDTTTPSVPSLGSWGAMILVLTLLTAGVWRRRRTSR